MRRGWIAPGLAAMVVAAACSSGGDVTPAVAMRGIAFVPSTLTIEPGTTVAWTNDDGFAHTVRADLFESGRLDARATFTHTFVEPGTFAYRCAIHPENMQGEVRVG